LRQLETVIADDAPVTLPPSGTSDLACSANLPTGLYYISTNLSNQQESLNGEDSIVILQTITRPIE